jgi:hypothetical protein
MHRIDMIHAFVRKSGISYAEADDVNQAFICEWRSKFLHRRIETLVVIVTSESSRSNPPIGESAPWCWSFFFRLWFASLSRAERTRDRELVSRPQLLLREL